jgi:hypothetical protein
MEKDFGHLEGKKWDQVPPEPTAGRAAFADVESKDSMKRRADTFLDEYLLPLLDSPAEPSELAIAIISHGMMLSALWKRLLLRLPPKSISFSPELAANPRVSLEHLGAWSNTGYLELYMSTVFDDTNAVPDVPSSLASDQSTSRDDTPVVKVETGRSDAQEVVLKDTDTGELGHEEANIQPAASITPTPSPKLTYVWTTVIQVINGKNHLQGLKRTRGGVGSAKHDASQMSINSFFKKQKIG